MFRCATDIVKFSKRNAHSVATDAQMYRIIYPDEITACSPEPTHSAYLYRILMEPDTNAAQPPDEDTLKFLTDPMGFAILTKKPLPPLARMKLHLDLATMWVQIDTAAPSTVQPMSTKELELLRHFHVMIFRDVLQNVSAFLAYDFANEENSYFIVPIKDCSSDSVTTTIDWSTVNAFQSLPREHGAKPDRKRQKFDGESYKGKVICPWYRADNTNYLVLRVHEHLTPFSPFPNDSYESYAAYISDKYQLTIANTEQFMIEVRAITNRSAGGLIWRPAATTGKDKVVSRGPELLIPELCHNFNFPSSLWLKAMLLPGCLHRLHHLLNAEQLRVRLNAKMNISSNAYRPLPVLSEYVKRPISHDGVGCGSGKVKPIPVRSIVIPNPDEAVVVEIAKEKIGAETANNSCTPWRQYDEPIDMDRNLDELYPIELKYYEMFISQSLQSLQLADGSIDKAMATNEFNWKQQQSTSILGGGGGGGGAICDVTEEERQRIGLLTAEYDGSTVGPEQRDILSALTINKSADVFDSDRWYILGSAYLSFGVKMHLLDHYSDWHVGLLRTAANTIMSQRNLTQLGTTLNLPGLIKVVAFSPKNDWMPPLLCVPRDIQVGVEFGFIFENI